MTKRGDVGYQTFTAEHLADARHAFRHELGVDLRPVPATFIARHLKTLHQPERMLAGTSLEGTNHSPRELLDRYWPLQITIRDYLTIVGNLATIGPDPGYHIEYANAGVPLFSGGLDIGMRFAPTARQALGLMCEYGSERPGYVEYLLYEEGEKTILEVRPTTSLGAASANIIESSILVVSRMIDRHLGRKVTKGSVELSYPSPPYVRRLKESLGKPIRFNAQRNCISVRTSDITAPSILYDEAQWDHALRICAEERDQRGNTDPLAEVRKAFVKLMRKTDKPPKLSTLVDALGVSDRTLIRRFRAAGISFQQFKDLALLSRASELLSDPALTVESVAEKLGFADPSGFHRSFRRWTGGTPKQFRDLRDSRECGTDLRP